MFCTSAGLTASWGMKVTLTEAERTRLRQTMKRATSARLYRRLQAVLLAVEGHSAAQIAAVTGASARSVQSWCAMWRGCRQCRHPQKALAEKQHLGRRPVVPALDRARLLSELAKDPLGLGYAATNWTVPLLPSRMMRPPIFPSSRLTRTPRTLSRCGNDGLNPPRQKAERASRPAVPPAPAGKKDYVFIPKPKAPSRFSDEDLEFNDQPRLEIVMNV